MEIKRYEYRTDCGGTVEDEDGSLVYHSAVLELIAVNEALAEALSMMNTQYRCDCGYAGCPHCFRTKECESALALQEKMKSGN